jgi:ribosomal protein L3
MLKGLIGKKIGMTQIFDEQGVAHPVTIIEAGPCYVTQVRTLEKEGYAAIQLGFNEIHPKKLSSGALGHLNSKNLPPMKFLREFRSKDSANVGDKLTVEVFSVGERVDVIGTSKGKGFAGGVKRYHFAGGKKTHVSLTVIVHPVPVLPARPRGVFSKVHVARVIWAVTESPPRPSESSWWIRSAIYLAYMAQSLAAKVAWS